VKIAQQVLEIAAEELRARKTGATVTVIVSDDHRDIQHDELMFHFKALAPTYGLVPGRQDNSQQTFHKA
jgi:hypothetical protein